MCWPMRGAVCPAFSFYPRGGCTVIAKRIIPVIERSGGRVLVQKAVERILTENGAA
jgi:all-trans-retinol 13,14-reductase